MTFDSSTNMIKLKEDGNFLADAMRLSAAGTAADPALAAATLALSFKSVFVVGAMAIGLLVGARIADLTSRRHRMSHG